jgi:hypothetical protein
MLIALAEQQAMFFADPGVSAMHASLCKSTWRRIRFTSGESSLSSGS